MSRSGEIFNAAVSMASAVHQKVRKQHQKVRKQRKTLRELSDVIDAACTADTGAIHSIDRCKCSVPNRRQGNAINNCAGTVYNADGGALYSFTGAGATEDTVGAGAKFYMTNAGTPYPTGVGKMCPTRCSVH